MSPLELSIIMNYFTTPTDPENITNPLHQEICTQYCEDGVLRLIEAHEVIKHEGYNRPHFEITEKGECWFAGIMRAVDSVPFPVYHIPPVG